MLVIVIVATRNRIQFDRITNVLTRYSHDKHDSAEDVIDDICLHSDVFVVRL